jgi:hypothetical protein
MKLVFFLIVIVLCAQREVTIFNVPDDTKVALLEAEIVKNTFKLYNAHNPTDRLKYNIVHLNKFFEVFEAIDKSNKKDYVFSMYQITITEERQKKYDFSSSYIPIKESIYTLKSRADKNFKKKGVRIAYQLGSTQEKQIEYLKSYEIKPVVYNVIGEKIIALRNNEVDFVIGDNIEIWGKSDMLVVEDMKNQPGDGFGFLYAKGSTLRNKLDPYILKYITSQSFFNYIIRNFGKEVAVYFKDNIKGSGY